MMIMMTIIIILLQLYAYFFPYVNDDDDDDDDDHHHHVVSLTSPYSLLHRLRFSASSFSLQQLLFSLRLPSSCLCLLLRLPFTSIVPSISFQKQRVLEDIAYTSCDQTSYCMA